MVEVCDFPLFCFLLPSGLGVYGLIKCDILQEARRTSARPKRTRRRSARSATRGIKAL